MDHLHLCITCVSHMESSAPNFPIRLNKYATCDSLFLWVSDSIFADSTPKGYMSLIQVFSSMGPRQSENQYFPSVHWPAQWSLFLSPSSGIFEQYIIYGRYCNHIIQLYFFFFRSFSLTPFPFFFLASFWAEEKFMFIKISIFCMMFDYGKGTMLILASDRV